MPRPRKQRKSTEMKGTTLNNKECTDDCICALVKFLNCPQLNSPELKQEREQAAKDRIDSTLRKPETK